MRQIAGAFAQLEKARLVGKLKAARDRKRATGCKVEGRKSHAEMSPAVVAMARKLYRKDRSGNRRSLRSVAAELAQQGHLSSAGTVFSPSIVKAMINR
jgi:hypothetical protein